METLQDIYNEHLIIFNTTKRKPQLDKMLLILLLEEKNLFDPLQISTKDFYRFYQRIIEEKINKIKTDFKITTQDIAELEKQKEITTDEGDYYLIENALEMFHNYIKNPNYNTSEEIYYQYYDFISKENNNQRTASHPKILAKYRKVNEVFKWIPMK